MTGSAPIRFRVYGTPKPQPRPRACRRGRHAGVYDPGTADAWKGDVVRAATHFRPRAPLVGPLSLVLTIWLPRPQKLCRKCDPGEAIPHTGTPDTDNLAKAIMDALTGMGFWVDDSHVSSLQVKKFYAAKGQEPGALIDVAFLN